MNIKPFIGEGNKYYDTIPLYCTIKTVDTDNGTISCANIADRVFEIKGN